MQLFLIRICAEDEAAKTSSKKESFEKRSNQTRVQYAENGKDETLRRVNTFSKQQAASSFAEELALNV